MNWTVADWLNYFSSVFNLLNVAIGSGIIGLGSVAANMGVIPYLAFNVVVVVISIFTLNLVCKSATRVYKWEAENNENEMQKLNTLDDENDDCEDIMESRTDHIMTSLEHIKVTEFGNDEMKRKDHPIAYSYEDIACVLYGKKMLIMNNICILFYLFSCICSYMTLIKDTMPDIAVGLVKMFNENAVIDQQWYTNGNLWLFLVFLCILFPLGCCKRIDFLGFTSAIGMFAMGTFVVMIVAKQPEIAQMCEDPGIDYPFKTENNSALIKFQHNITTECSVKLINLSSDSIFSAGILIFAYMSHCNVLAIFAEVKTRSLERMQKVIYGALIPCTILYMTAAIFAYSSFFNHTQPQLIQLYSFIESDGSAITICNILVMTCIIFSIPLALYPARSTLWKLIHTFMPSFPAPFVPAELNLPRGKGRPFPWQCFYPLMVAIYLFVFGVVVSNADFGLFLALAGAVSGSTVIMIFPTLFHLKMENWDYKSFENFSALAILIFGVFILFGNTSLVVYKELTAE